MHKSLCSANTPPQNCGGKLGLEMHSQLPRSVLATPVERLYFHEFQ